MQIRKRVMAAAIGVTFAAGQLAMNAAHAVDKIRCSVPMAFGSSLTALGDTMPGVAQLLDKMSGGAIKFSVQEPGKLIPALAVFDNVSAGKVEAGYTWDGLRDRQAVGIGVVRRHAVRARAPRVHRLVLLRRWRQDGQGTLCAA